MPKKKEPTETPVTKEPKKSPKSEKSATATSATRTASATKSATTTKTTTKTTPPKAASKSAAKKPVVPAPATEPAASAPTTEPAAPAPATEPATSAPPAESVAAIEPEVTQPVTIVVAKYDVGHGNNLFIRGEGGGLSWETGTQMENAGNDVWVWTAHNVNESQVAFKFLINDEIWCDGENMTAQTGETTTLYPSF